MSNTKSIEFQDIGSENSQNPTARKSFRVPLEKGGMTAEIDSIKFDVVDISFSGISISCGTQSPFMVSQEIKDCSLETPEGRISGLTGRVIHYTCGSDDDWHNGIQWVELDTESAGQIEDLVVRLKKVLLDADKGQDPEDI